MGAAANQDVVQTDVAAGGGTLSVVLGVDVQSARITWTRQWKEGESVVASVYKYTE